MNVNEAKEYLSNERSVTFNGIKFKKISELSFRKSENGFKAYASLLDYNENSVLIVPVSRIEISESQDTNETDKEILTTISNLEEIQSSISKKALSNKKEELKEEIANAILTLMRLDEIIREQKKEM
ncbi:MAG: hypothetical protein Q4A42_02925 [Tissierellia bacterium]|nr:hypothetical protein [Tissierellia bacterium]